MTQFPIDHKQLLNTLDSSIAVIDTHGVIRYVNKAWRSFSRNNNGSTLTTKGVTLNYIDALASIPKDSPDFQIAHACMRGISAVITGRKKVFTIEYPCFTPERRLWFLMRIMPIKEKKTIRGAIITHIDITARKLREHDQKHMISVVGHELKNPINILYVYISLLDRKIHKLHVADELSIPVEQIKRATDRINNMVKHILDSTRLELKTFRLRRRKTQLVTLVSKCIDDYTLAYPDYTFVCSTPKSLSVRVDANRLTQVITNLLDNAVKYSPKKTTIRLSLRSTSTHAILRIKDHGIGIESSDVAEIFSRYYQTKRTSQKGLGLGLYICKHIVTLHKGTIHCNSIPGKGTTFTVQLPL